VPVSRESNTKKLEKKTVMHKKNTIWWKLLSTQSDKAFSGRGSSFDHSGDGKKRTGPASFPQRLVDRSTMKEWRPKPHRPEHVFFVNVKGYF